MHPHITYLYNDEVFRDGYMVLPAVGDLIRVPDESNEEGKDLYVDEIRIDDSGYVITLKDVPA